MPIKPVTQIANLRELLVSTCLGHSYVETWQYHSDQNGIMRTPPGTKLQVYLLLALSNVGCLYCLLLLSPYDQSTRVALTWQVGMKKRYAAEEARVRTCWSTLLKYIGNVVQVHSYSKPFWRIARSAL